MLGCSYFYITCTSWTIPILANVTFVFPDSLAGLKFDIVVE